MEPGCSAMKAAEPLPRVQQRETVHDGVGVVSPDDMSPGQVAFFSNVPVGRK